MYRASPEYVSLRRLHIFAAVLVARHRANRQAEPSQNESAIYSPSLRVFPIRRYLLIRFTGVSRDYNRRTVHQALFGRTRPNDAPQFAALLVRHGNHRSDATHGLL